MFLNAIASSSRHVPPPQPQPQPEGPERALRVSQVDSDELDEGLVGMLSENLERSFRNFKGRIWTDLKPEIGLVLKLVIFRFGICGGGSASPGGRLQKLKLVSGTSRGRVPRKSLVLYLLLHPPIFPSYILHRLRQLSLSRQYPDLPLHDYRRRLWNLLLKLENAAKVWELIGWSWFLWDGKYPSLLMRILGIRLVPSSPHLTRMVSYEFMNRQLVWGVLTEFMMFSFPLLPTLPTSLSPTSLLRPFKQLLPPEKVDYSLLASAAAITSSEHDGGLTGSANGGNRRKYTGPLASLPKETCPICHLRFISSPIHLDASTIGQDLSLPRIEDPILRSSANGRASVVNGEIVEGVREETEIYVPAQGDCWGGCWYCYYCLAGELVLHAQRISGRGDGVDKSEKEGWGCLRCGGCISRAWRVGAESDALERSNGVRTHDQKVDDL